MIEVHFNYLLPLFNIPDAHFSSVLLLSEKSVGKSGSDVVLFMFYKGLVKHLLVNPCS